MLKWIYILILAMAIEKQEITFEDSNEFFDKLVQVAVFKEASDIHILPGKERVTVQFRLFWELRTLYTFPIELFQKINNTVKIRALMDISEQNHVQDGKIFMQIQIEWKTIGVNLRISTLPTLNGENIVIRVLVTSSKFLDIDSLGFGEKTQKLLKNAAQINEWLVLVCGWTWSWKTTTLYAMLHEHDPNETAIFTLENPVEFVVNGYVQSQIHIVWGDSKDPNSYTFSEGLIGILRQDPDIIMIWEMRRKEETETCLEAANTGHVVMWTIHSNSAIWVIARIRQFDIPSYLIASSLKYIICQKMVKLLCNECKIQVSMVKNDLPENYAKHIKPEKIEVFTHNPDGCKVCNMGFNERVVLTEIIKVDDDIYRLILDNSWEDEIRNHLLANGWMPIYLDGLKKAIEWNIDIHEAIKLDH